jgi:hypothetical protein
LQLALDSKSNVNHTHEISEVNNLQAVLDGKAPSNHMHTLAGNLSDVDLISTMPINGDSLVFDGVHWVPMAISGGSGPTYKFLEGKVFRLDMDGSTPRIGDNTTYAVYDNVYEEGLSPITWDVNGYFDSITIPSGSNVAFKKTMWEVTCTIRLTPITEFGSPSSWLVDNPGIAESVRYGSYIDVNSGGEIVQLADAEYDKYVTPTVEGRDIMWTQTVAVKTSEFSDLRFRPVVSVGLVNGVPNTAIRFAGSVMVNIKYMGEVYAAPQS